MDIERYYTYYISDQLIVKAALNAPHSICLTMRLSENIAEKSRRENLHYRLNVRNATARDFVIPKLSRAFNTGPMLAGLKVARPK